MKYLRIASWQEMCEDGQYLSTRHHKKLHSNAGSVNNSKNVLVFLTYIMFFSLFYFDIYFLFFLLITYSANLIYV